MEGDALDPSITIKDEPSDANKLLPEVWELIASRMTSKDWARARCAHPAMLKARVDIVRAKPLNTSELARIARDVPTAKTLWLDLTSLTSSSSLFSKIWRQNVADLGHLQQLSLVLSSKAHTHRQGPAQRGESLSSRTAALGDVLASAHSLTVLRLNVADVPALPPMKKLQHLNLLSAKPISQETCQWLERLTSLQTLSLEQSPDVDLATAYEAPPLDLSACRQLRSITLFHMIPEDLSVPEKCAVTVWTDHLSLRRSWEDIYSTSCRACSVFVPDRRQVLSTFFVDMFAVSAANLLALRIELQLTVSGQQSPIGSQSQPLVLADHTVPNLRAFRGRARDIFLKLGGKLRLESLRCDAQVALHIDTAVQNLATVLNKVKHLELFWSANPVHSGRMHHQLRALGKAGMRCEVKEIKHPVILKSSFYGSFGSRYNYSYEASYHAAQGSPGDEVKLCLGCGACGVCLQEKHGISGLFGPP